MLTPLVSVVVATYRRDDALNRALDSLAHQTYKNFEIIIVDDNGDTYWNQKVDGIVNAFRQSNPEVSIRLIVNNPNQGSAQTRNIGIYASNGDYITFLDDDDIYFPDKIEKQILHMLQVDADYSLMDMDLYYDDESFCGRRTRLYIKDMDKNAMIRYHLMYHMTGTDTMMFKKEYLLQIGAFDPIDVGDEFYLMLKAIEANGKFDYLNEVHVKAYVHRGEGGLSSGQGKIDGENRLFAFKERYFDRISASDVRFIKTRHYAVLAFAELRRKKFFGFLFNAAMAFFVAPIHCLKLLRDHR